MSLDCYPLVTSQQIGLCEQPMALDVAYEENLLVTVIDGCQTVVVYNLEGTEKPNNQPGPTTKPLASFSLGASIVVEHVVYCKTGDYIACVGHQNGSPALYAVFDWRQPAKGSSDSDESLSDSRILIEQLDLSTSTTPIDELDRAHKLEDIAVCQRTGNLAASYGDLVVIYKFNGLTSRGQETLAQVNGDEDFDKLSDRTCPFVHIISVKLTILAHSISLVENYLSLSTSDHVQVIKLELLTLQIQSDGQNGELQNAACNQVQSQANRSSSGSSGGQGANSSSKHNHRSSSNAVAASGRNRRRVLMNSEGGDELATHGAAMSSTTASSCLGGNDTDSIISDSNNSTTTNFSGFNTTATTITEEAELHERQHDERLASATTPDCSDGELDGGAAGQIADQIEQQLNNDSDMSIITMNNNNITQQPQQAPPNGGDPTTADGDNLRDDCVTWNLNTKKLVKLPTLMHNTSSDLSSYHICHPLELLGPASESIACRVLARLYAADFCQNQLEPVVLLCKQFDCERAPVKTTHLQPIYLTGLDEQKRLSAGRPSATEPSEQQQATANLLSAGPADNQQVLLKSLDHELLASVTCFVATLSNCFIYALHGKKVLRLQTITHPDLCLDLRPDLLNVLLLTPLGLQICSSGLCDATFRYDWSSSADLNLSFLACNRARVLATSKFIVLISSSPPPSEEVNGDQACCCFIEVLLKPNSASLFERVVHTIKRCQSISIRSNLLTYLHARALICINQQQQLSESPSPQKVSKEPLEAVEMLRGIAIMLCKQLLQKKQTNVITNSRIDRAIKHLLDISHCDLSELMSRHLEQLNQLTEASMAEEVKRLRLSQRVALNGMESYEDEDDFREFGAEDDEDEQPVDCDYELLTIYLRHSKYNPSILTYLQANSTQESTCSRIISYMFDHNPRLLIKCAQRYVAMDNSTKQRDPQLCLNLLIERLKQLAEFDSTGINRATVLFTLANLYRAIESDHDDEQPFSSRSSLATLSQIKPLSHLAITMCSNHEIIGHSMARLVAQNYPEVYKLFLSQLAKRDAKLAWREFSKIQEEVQAAQVRQAAKNDDGQPAQSHDLIMANRGAKLRLFGSTEESTTTGEGELELDEDELFERRLRLVAELEPVELADLFLNQKSSVTRQEDSGHNSEPLDGEDDETIEAYLRASICLQESQFILARLCENSR